MPKFISHDGVDKNGVRAEVTVMTGTGVITEIVGRGKQNEDGSYRNVEVVFAPDNPLLKRKVYGLLDTTSAELWDYIKQAHESGKNISYRIESQRRNGVDRNKPIGDLVPTEDVRRILAAIDGHFSHEAKTNPAEDPDNENPSALTQAMTGAAPAAGNATDVDIDAIVAAVTAAVTDAFSPLFDERGTLNYGSDAVARAAHAEQFALNHLVAIYTPARAKTPVDVTDEMLAQAASLAGTLLAVARDVHQDVLATGGVTLTDASHRLALDLTLDAVATRHPAPLGGDADTQQTWRDAVTKEAADRMYAIGCVAQGLQPTSRPDTMSTPVDMTPAAETAAAQPHSDVHEEIVTVDVATETEPAADFIAPSDDLVNRVRQLCEAAGVLDHPREISDWIEASLGERSARKVHAPRLEAFVTHFENAGPAAVRNAVLAHAAA